MKTPRSPFAARVTRRGAFAAAAVVALSLSTAACDFLVTKPSLYGKVDVLVTRRNGDPIPSTPVTLYTGERRMGYGTTDADGAYTFLYVPEGRYGVSADIPPGYARLEHVLPGQPTDFVDQLVVARGVVPVARLSLLKQGTGTIVVSVAEPDGKAVPGIAVTLYTAAGTIKSGVTDATGKYTFDPAPFGNLGVSALKTATYLDSAENPFATRDGVVIEEGSAEAVSFTFAPCFGAVAATVRDDTGGPVPGATLTLYTSAGALDSGAADSTGVRLFTNLGCANYGVSVGAVPIGWTVPPGRGSSFVDGLFVHRASTRAASLVIQRVACRATLRIRVNDNAGAAVSGAQLNLYFGDVTYRVLLTGIDGLATFTQIPCDREWGVYVTPPATHTVTFGPGSSYFDGIRFTDGETLERAFVLTRR